MEIKLLFLILGLFIVPFIICACIVSGEASRKEEEEIYNEKDN